jgi:succinoglycan biosynthesis transport protein ExoP
VHAGRIDPKCLLETHLSDIPALNSSTELFGDLQLREYLQVLKRRRGWVIFTATAVFCVVLVVAVRLPSVYRSETVILVDPQKVPDTFVQSTVSSSVSDRLSTIQQEVMSPSRLTDLIHKLHLYPELQGKVNEQQIVTRMQKAISVEIVAGGHQLSAFRIAFSSRNPAQAAQVANQLAAMFINENLKTREQQSLGTTEFLENELQKTKRQLDAKDAELRKIKSQNVMDLPESQNFHIQTLESLREQLQASEDRVGRDQQEKVYLQSSMNATPPTIDLDQNTTASPYQSQLSRLEAQLSQLSSRYGPSHPDVRKVQAELDALRDRIGKEKPEASPQPEEQLSRRRIHNPVLEAQLERVNQDIADQMKLQAELQEQIKFHASRLERIPVFQQQIAGRMRDYDTLRAHYTGLLDKELAAQMSSNLEDRQKGERFVVLDSAEVPDKPFGPNRILISLGGIFGGLLSGIGLAVVIEMADQSVRSEREAAMILGKPVLAGIPEVFTPQRVIARRVQATVALVATAAAAAALGVVLTRIGAAFFVLG